MNHVLLVTHDFFTSFGLNLEGRDVSLQKLKAFDKALHSRLAYKLKQNIIQDKPLCF